MTTHPAPLHASPDVSSFHTIRSEEEGGGDEDDDEEEEEEEDSEGEEVRHPLLPSHISNEQAASFSSYHPADVRPLATFVNGGAQQHLPNGDVRITMDPAEAEAAPLSSATERYPRELLKTLLAFVFLIFSWVTTGISLALVHENRPETPPLPDQVLDHVIYQQWALFASEYLIQFQTFTAVTVMLFHRHRWIVGRRSALLIGVLYLYRAFTMWVTVLPKADAAYPCAPKAGQNLTAGEVAERAFKILTGMGLSINGQHVFCGDYIYSGHTVMIIMGYLIVKEYTPKHFFLLHWLTWFNACTSIILLLLSRGHYTIDVIIAYFIATRTWATYHTFAGHFSLRQPSAVNHFSRFWWFEPVRWFEKNVKAGKLPNEYNLPLPSKFLQLVSRRCRRCRRKKGKVKKRDAVS